MVLGLGGYGVRHRRAVTHAVRSPVRPETRGRRVVSTAQLRAVAGKIMVTRLVGLEVRPSDEWSTKWASQKRFFLT
jgi:hypothetical protein